MPAYEEVVMRRPAIVTGNALALALGVAAIGCGGKSGNGPDQKPLKVNVSAPVVQSVTDYEIFSGRTEAIESTDVRARVSGYLEKIRFNDGDFVKAGDVLFEIDSRPYDAALAKAKASVEQAKASIRQGESTVARDESMLMYLSTEYERNRTLSRTRSVSETERDKSQSDVRATSASLKASKASVELAKANLRAAEAEERTAQLNVDFTKVLAPISGVVSRRFVDRGTLVTADQMVLTNIARTDKVYAYFDVDERSWLDLRRRLLNQGQIASLQKAVLPVWVGLANDPGYSYEGVIDFADNRLDPSTGTMRLRGTFENGDLFFQPGMFVRVRLPVGRPHEAFLIADQAIGNDQGRQFVYVVDDKNEVIYRRVETGARHNGLREIKPPREGGDSGDPGKAEGLRKGDRIILNGLQRLRPGMQVEPTVVPMPRPKEEGTPTAARERNERPAAKGKARADGGAVGS
jgi:RND family efflux transporter MFP subunit